MRLNITDFARIKHSDIIVDGITIIAGENNTGKSTVGKILFSLFNTVSGIEDKILYQRIWEIKESVQSLLVNFSLAHSPGRMVVRDVPIIAGRIAEYIQEIYESQRELEYIEIRDIIAAPRKRYLIDNNIAILPEIYDDITNKIKEILDLPEKTISLEILTRYFNDVFHGQVNSLVEQDTTAQLNLEIKNKQITLSFNNNQCINFKSEMTLLHKAVYIDNPFIIDKLEKQTNLNRTDHFLKDLLTKSANNDIMDGIIETVLAKEKLQEISKALQLVVEGQIITEKEEFYLTKEGFRQPIAFNNLSTGLKSFVIMKMLVEKGIIKEKDILILDEPEIHLHPQWQVAYAELIVLLQKYFDLSIIVTTHSPYFLDAINLFSVKYGLNEKVNYYLSSMEDNEVKMANVTGNVDLIYQRMASPIQMLDSLRYELNNKE